MATAPEAIARYRSEYEVFERAAVATRVALETVCRRAGVLAHIEVRPKSLSSFVKKTRIKRDRYTDFWGEMSDKVGGRVILATPTDSGRALEALLAANDLFASIGALDDKSADVGPEEFTYPGKHVPVWLLDPVLSDGERIECEIQVRTQAEDLWAVPEHKLVYKRADTPWIVKRRLFRLRTLVELIDEELDRAVAEAANDADEAVARLLQIAEREYYRFVGEAGEDELSMQVIESLVPALPSDFAVYEASLHAFVDEQEDKLTQLYQEYGIGSEFEALPEYFLCSQPESVLILEAAQNRPSLLKVRAESGGFLNAIQPLVEAWGVDL